MYTCVECGFSFERPVRLHDRHGLDTPPFEELLGCPECGGAFVESITCNVCSEHITDYYIKTDDGQNICEHCYTECHIAD